ncbi:hypothetical protein EJB05_51274, partial [Eragrostis curvula]
MGIDVPTRTFFASVPGKSTRHRHCRLPRKQELPPPSSQARAAAVMLIAVIRERWSCGHPLHFSDRRSHEGKLIAISNKVKVKLEKQNSCSIFTERSPVARFAEKPKNFFQITHVTSEYNGKMRKPSFKGYIDSNCFSHENGSIA